MAWIDPENFKAMMETEHTFLRYLTRHPRNGDIPLYINPPNAAARIAELEAERDRLRAELAEAKKEQQ